MVKVQDHGPGCRDLVQCCVCQITAKTSSCRHFVQARNTYSKLLFVAHFEFGCKLVPLMPGDIRDPDAENRTGTACRHQEPKAPLPRTGEKRSVKVVVCVGLPPISLGTFMEEGNSSAALTPLVPGTWLPWPLSPCPSVRALPLAILETDFLLTLVSALCPKGRQSTQSNARCSAAGALSSDNCETGSSSDTNTLPLSGILQSQGYSPTPETQTAVQTPSPDNQSLPPYPVS